MGLVRSHRLLHESEECNVWEITWPPGSGLDWHDHGSSDAHIFMSSGTLIEYMEISAVERSQPAGSWWLVPRRVQHKIVNESVGSAVSIHVYRPPLNTVYSEDLEIGN